VVAAGVTVLLLPVPNPLSQLTLPLVQFSYANTVDCPALMVEFWANAKTEQGVTLTVTEEEQVAPPPDGVQVAV